MMITENNCEEYFLLYIDDELSSAERNAVAAFVQQHPQYKAILDSFLQTKLTDDEPVLFDNKNTLYKNADSEIGIDNYEEYFLLYTDNELTGKEKENTERFVLQHPQLQPEFTLLQQTKLPSETITYPGKEKLYKEEKKRRILPLYMVRMSVAAAVLGIIAFAWRLTPSVNITTNKPIVVIAKAADKSTIKMLHPKTLSQPVKLPQQTTVALQQPTDIHIQTKPSENKVSTVAKTIGSDKIKQKTEDVIAPAATTQDEQVAIVPTETAMQTQIASADNKTETKTAAVLRPLDVSDEETNKQTAFSLSDDNILVQPAVYKELKTEDESQTLYVGVLQLNKAKVNGFLKSASRLLGSRTKQNAE